MQGRCRKVRRRPRTLGDVNRDFQQKGRHEFESLPDTKARRRGERELYTPNDSDNYAIINTRDGWKTVAFLTVESSMPANSVGQNGEYRILSSTGKNSIIFKSNDEWHELNYEAIDASSSSVDSRSLSTSGSSPTHLMTSTSISTCGYHQ